MDLHLDILQNSLVDFNLVKMIPLGIQKSTIPYLYFLEIVHKIFTKVEVYYFIKAVVLKDCTNSHFY